MDTMEEKLAAILNNPKMMQQIMALAQSMGENPDTKEKPSPQLSSSIPDLSGLQKLSGIAGQSSIDQNQKQLLMALSPYLTSDRVNKLENAMRAAKLAKLASSFLGNGGLQMLTGR